MAAGTRQQRDPFGGIETTIRKAMTQLASLKQRLGNQKVSTGGNRAFGGNKAGSTTRGKARTGTTRRGRRANTAANQPPNALS